LGASGVDAGLLLAAGAHLFGVAMTIQRAGSDAQKARWLPDLAQGHCIATVAATEREAGSDVAAVKAEIAPRGNRWLATGDKHYVTWGDRAGLFLFLGRDPQGRGLTTALVDNGATPGALHPTGGLRGARLCPVRFDSELDEDGVLGKPGAGMSLFQIAMTYERALVLAFRLGAMSRALDQGVAFVRKRGISKHQAVSHRLARMRLRLETSRLLVYRAAWLLDDGDRAHADAALAKWHVAESALQSALDATSLRAGAAYVDERFSSDLQDCIGGTIHSGTSDVLANIVAGWLGL